MVEISSKVDNICAHISKNVGSGHRRQQCIGRDVYEARRLVPPQNFGPLWSVLPRILPNYYSNQRIFLTAIRVLSQNTSKMRFRLGL